MTDKGGSKGTGSIHKQEWHAYCIQCTWRRDITPNPLFHSARAHTRDTGHETEVLQVHTWSIKVL